MLYIAVSGDAIANLFVVFLSLFSLGFSPLLQPPLPIAMLQQVKHWSGWPETKHTPSQLPQLPYRSLML